jgi:hypothetical protein
MDKYFYLSECGTNGKHSGFTDGKNYAVPVTLPDLELCLNDAGREKKKNGYVD